MFLLSKKMDETLKRVFRVNIETKIGFEFEEFIDELFLLKYGSENYIPIRSNKDKGNDGTVLIEKKYWIVMLQKNMTKASLRERL
ncbi:MAG: hypothetical protein OXC61_06005 [Flavobacteriaceae bacterium]|nr:hypothetical protein [Flavobacteriaceae bacterium]